jgi:hypothetical protein
MSAGQVLRKARRAGPGRRRWYLQRAGDLDAFNHLPGSFASRRYFWAREVSGLHGDVSKSVRKGGEYSPAKTSVSQEARLPLCLANETSYQNGYMARERSLMSERE